MCGFFGHFELSRSTKGVPCADRLQDCLKTLSHRGPDDQGIEVFSVNQSTDAVTALLALGHTRLSIIDLSLGGHQPMQSINGRYTIVFNGEIYNYRELRQDLRGLGHTFQTDSDTEVLLAAWASWGVSGLRRLIGMFAFAIYDRADQSLTLVRDAFGIKPLFYHYDSSGFCFASEIPALLCLLEKVPSVRPQQAYDYLVFGGFDYCGGTFYEGVHQIPPGQFLRIELRPFQVGTVERWWRPSIEERNQISFEEAAATLREMFLNSVRLHLRSDVPVGAALSGGIDSSAIVCAIRHLEPDIPISTFSFVARGSIANEEKWVDLINDFVGAIPHKVFVQDHELAEDLVDLIGAQGEPFGSTSIYAQYRVFKAAKQAGITVILDGQGADEMLAGYSGYPDRYLRSLFENHRYVSALAFLRNWSKWHDTGSKRVAQMLSSAVVPERFRDFMRIFVGRDHVPCWVNLREFKRLGVRAVPFRRKSTDKHGRGRRLAEELRIELTETGLSTLLRYADRNSMRWSVEGRVPFLTIELVEFLLSLPESYLLSANGETKRIFRHSMRGIVPDLILNRRDKIGFQTPERNWLSCLPFVDKVNEISRKSTTPFIQSDNARGTFRLGELRLTNSDSSMWRRLNFELWTACLSQ